MLILLAGMSLLIAGGLAVLIVLNVASFTEMRDDFVRLVQVMVIMAVVSGGLLALGSINKD